MSNSGSSNNSYIVGRSIDYHSADLSIITRVISPLICRSICWPIHLGRYIGRLRTICRPTYRSSVDRYIGRLSVDMSTDISIMRCTKYTWSSFSWCLVIRRLPWRQVCWWQNSAVASWPCRQLASTWIIQSRQLRMNWAKLNTEHTTLLSRDAVNHEGKEWTVYLCLFVIPYLTRFYRENRCLKSCVTL